MFLEVKHRRTGAIAYILNEDLDGKVQLYIKEDDGKEDRIVLYAQSTFKKFFVKNGNAIKKEEIALTIEDDNKDEIKNEDKAENKDNIEIENEIKNEVKTTIPETIMNEVIKFVNSKSELEYKQLKSIDKVTFKNKNLFEIDIQKRGINFYFNTSTLQQNNVNLMTKIVPESYGWSSNGIYKVISLTQIDTLLNIINDTYNFKKQQDEEKNKAKKR